MRKLSILSLCILTTAALPGTLHAAPLYWDLNGTTAGAGGPSPSGTWDGALLNWNPAADGTGTPVAWTNTADTAVFSAGNDATGVYTVTITGTQTAAGVTIEDGTVVIPAGTAAVGTGAITIGTGATLSINSSTRVSGTAGSKVTLDGGTLIQTNPSNAGSFIPAAMNLEIGPNGGTVNYTSSGTGSVAIYGGTAGTIVGTGTLTKTGPNEFRYQGVGLPNTTFTKLVVNQGLYRLGFNQNISDERGFGAVPATFTQDAITLSGGGSIGTSFTAANSVLHANRGITLGSGGGAIVGSMTVPGAIAGTGSLTTSSGTVNLNGANTYSGGTNVNGGTMNANGGLGATTGPLSVNNNNTTAAGNNVILNLRNTAPNITGSLSGVVATPISGTNTATINNGGQQFTVNQTTPGSFAGVIAGAGGFELGELSTAALTLTGANTYAGGTTVDGGELILGAPAAALGSGDVTVTNTAEQLTIQSGVLNAIADSASLLLAGGGVAGTADAGFADLGAGVNEVVTSLVLGGVPQLPGTYGSSLSGATFQNNEYFAGAGVITVIPEPSTTMVMLGGLGMLVGWRRLRRLQ